jgi:hypothetical protein
LGISEFKEQKARESGNSKGRRIFGENYYMMDFLSTNGKRELKLATSCSLIEINNIKNPHAPELFVFLSPSFAFLSIHRSTLQHAVRAVP